jgi:hypothetical protein
MTADCASLVETFAIPHRAREAFWRLLAIGSSALPVVRAGLHHANADVRSWCCRYLDHFVDGDSMDALIAMLDDPDPSVRMWSLHALACDNCKEDESCRIDSNVMLPRAIALLRSESDAHLRAYAVGAIGKYVHGNATALAALMEALANDASPAVRKKAAWYVPGGPIYRRTAPKPVRVKRNAAG